MTRICDTAVRIVAASHLPAANDTAAWRRWLADAEIAACRERRDAVSHLAARLAAKRALIAAVGWAGPWHPMDVVVSGGLGGAPSLRVRGALVTVAALHAPRLACGLDLLDVARWDLALRRRGDAVVRRVTSPHEAAADAEEDADSRALSGVRFSLKECLIKALGGLPHAGGFHHISVPRPRRRPLRLETAGAVAESMHERLLAVGSASVRVHLPGVVCSSVVLTGMAA